MIVEMRRYTFHPGGVEAFLELYQAGPLTLQRRVLGNLLGYYATETGRLNEVVHLWGYESLDDRARRRAALAVEQTWRDFLAQALPMFLYQESTILRPTAFSPGR